MAAEGTQTANDRRQLGDAVIGSDKVGKSILHSAEGRKGLHEAAQSDGACKILGRRHHDRHDDSQLGIAVDIEVQQLRLTHELPEIADDPAEPLPEARPLRSLPAVKGNALAVLPHPHHIEAEISLISLLVKVQADELSAHQMGSASAQDRINERKPEHIAIDDELMAPDGHREGTGEVP